MDEDKKNRKRVLGTFLAGRRGFGFVSLELGGEDIYISEENRRGAVHGDRVEIEIFSSADHMPGGKKRHGSRKQRQEGGDKRHRTGRVLSVLERAVKELIGTFQEGKRGQRDGFILPDREFPDIKFFVPADGNPGAKSGDKVFAEIRSWGEEDGADPEAHIIEVLGRKGDPGVDVLSLVRSREIPDCFSEEALTEAERLPDRVLAEELGGRIDLRSLMTVTIDGEDSKDFDDAISLSYEEGRYFLKIHIADVAHYVREGSTLDREARDRGCSVYLADRVIPMLPPKLSNGICSLKPGEDRLCLSLFMVIDEGGAVEDYTLMESVIRSDYRLTYDLASAILEEGEGKPEERSLYDFLLSLDRLTEILQKKRRERGAIDFDFTETGLRLDEEGRVLEVFPRVRNRAMRIIEECMLLANETVADHCHFFKLPSLYRIHGEPDPEKLLELKRLCLTLGYRLKTGKRGTVRPQQIQALLEEVKDQKEEMVIQKLALRTMDKARYSAEAGEHFALASFPYTHFTSPIRRYPDLQIHRIIKESLRGPLSEERREGLLALLPEVAGHSSQTERRAEETEREVDKMKKAEFMEGHIGESYEGRISGVTSFGLFVELENGCEGLVLASDMRDDYYIYNEEDLSMTGRRYGRVYQPGESVRVEVKRADKESRQIDLLLLE